MVGVLMTARGWSTVTRQARLGLTGGPGGKAEPAAAAIVTTDTIPILCVHSTLDREDYSQQ